MTLLKSQTIQDWVKERPPPDLERFLSPRLAHLTPPDSMADRAAATDRIARAVRSGEPIAVFGDYDCDGITATAILTEAIRALGGRVRPFLASRFEGGYGLSGAATQKVLASEPGLLITCDCGSSDHASLRKVAEAGVDTVVIDHHLVPEEELPAVAFLNPHRPECSFPYKGLASCGLALSISAGLRRSLGKELDVRQWLDLVAIGTIADVAPLDGDNRALVRAGLDALQQPQRPGLVALFEQLKITAGAPVSGRDVAFRIAPQINAPGRMGSPELALQLLLARDGQTATELAQRIRQISLERRAQQDQILEEAEQQVRQLGAESASALVVGAEGWNHGVVGIVAGRLADKYDKPSVVIAFEGSVGRGSVRGPAGSSLHAALSCCREHLRRFGGHQAAAGLELEAGALEAFRLAFCQAIAEQAPVAVAELAQLPVTPQDDPREVLADLDLLEPCGEGNPRPRLQWEGRLVRAREVGGGHLKLELQLAGGQLLGGFAINMGDRAAEVQGAQVRLQGDLRHNFYAGVDRAELFVEELQVLA